MLVRRTLLSLSTLFILVALVSAQETTPEVPFSQEDFAPTVTPGADDPRLSLCSAPSLDGFMPHIVRSGERLADLLTGTVNISVTQLAALNCLDDPNALPVGGTVWIPAHDSGDAFTNADDAPALIRSFSASEPAIQNQDNLSFTWDATGSEAYFYQCPANADDNDCPRSPTTNSMPLQHEVTLSDFPYAGTYRFRLEVRGLGQRVTKDLSVEVTCSQRWLGPMTGAAACPAEPARSLSGAWQPFQGGVMMWFRDTKEIWVMTNVDHRLLVFKDTYIEGEPNPADEAPEGLFTPERGFGKVWRTIGGTESALGWAMSPETGIDTARQQAGSRSYTQFIQGPGDTVYSVTRIPQLGLGLWEKVAG